MEYNAPLFGKWMKVSFNQYFDIIEIKNENADFFFGIASDFLIHKNLLKIKEPIDKKNQDNIGYIARKLATSLEEKRDVFLEFTVCISGRTINIVGHIEYEDETHLALYLTQIHDKDTNTTNHAALASSADSDYLDLKNKYDSLYIQNYTILESLPVGVEIYSNDGDIMYLNKKDCEIFGIEREYIITRGGNIFDNPNLPEIVKEAFRKKEKIRTHFPYNFDLASDTDFYTSAYSHLVRQIECNGAPIINKNGEVENYAFIVEDITEDCLVKKELRQSKKKNELAILASDVMLWEFSTKTQLFVFDRGTKEEEQKKIITTVDELINTTHPDDVEQIKSIIKEMQNGTMQTYKMDARFKLFDDNDWQYCTVNCSPFEIDSNGKVSKYVGFRKNNSELEKKKQLLNSILNCINSPILIKDVEDNFRYIFCNEESKKMFGCTEQQSASNILDEKQAAEIQLTDMKVFNTGIPFFGQEKIVLRDGRTYETLVHKSIIYDNNKRLLFTMRWDQSSQNDLERRSKILSISMDALNAYTWFYDLQQDQLTFGNGFEKTEGDAIAMSSRKKFAEHVHPEDRKRFLDTMNSMSYQDTGEFSIEYRIDFNNDGIYKWWECRGVLETCMISGQTYKYMFGMDIDIESHKKIELTLRENEEHMTQLIRQNDLILNNTNSGLAYISTDYIVQWENISICSKSLSFEAYKRGELCYKSAHNRTTPCENCVIQRATLSRQTEKIEFLLDNRKSVEIFATPVFVANGEIDGVVIRVDDITERREMITALEKAKQKAEESDKLKSAFLANMSHEIRTPLNAIVGFSDLLTTTVLAEEREEYMHIIKNNNDLLLKLINDILDLSKIEAGSIELKYQEFDMADYFNEQATAMQQRITNPKIRLISVNPYASCIVKLDKSRLTQILTNYITNAIKYTPEGIIEMGYERIEDSIRIYVKDTGIGISKDKLNKVFQRFEKLDEFAQGTGLGLSICKAIAEACGGSVGFESEDKKGSTFWANLPCLLQKEINTEKKRKALALTKQKTILVAEDIQSNYLLVSKILRDNFKVLHAENGKSALEEIQKGGIDLVLMDMKMPVMNGLEATAEIRKINKEIPIVALTAHAFDTDKIAAYEAGCNEYLIKPINKVTLIEVLNRFCK